MGIFEKILKDLFFCSHDIKTSKKLGFVIDPDWPPSEKLDGFTHRVTIYKCNKCGEYFEDSGYWDWSKTVKEWLSEPLRGILEEHVNIGPRQCKEV